MILLQNPSVPTPTNPVEIDAAILDIKTELETGLSWLTNGYGRAYKNLDITNGERVYFPEIYLGKQGNSFRYTNITPDNDKTGQCFFFVRRETITEYQQGMFGFLNYDVSLIFSVNMELIQSTLIETEIYQQNLVAQVRDVLTRQILGKNYQITINNIEYLFEDVFRDFNLSEQSTIEKSPLSHFRVNLSIVLPESCPVPLLPSISCFSMDLDGVNEYIQAPINAAFDLTKTDSMSFEGWVRFDSIANAQYILQKHASGKGILFAVRSTGEMQLHLQNNGGLNALITNSSGALIGTGVWIHLAVTYDGSNTNAGVKFYKNGVLLPSTTVANSLTGTITNTEPVKLGTLCNGLLNIVRWWKTELTPAEILTQYNSGVPVINAVQSANLILESNSGNGATWNGSEFDIADLTGITAGYTTVNAEEPDKIEDCPT